MRADAQKRKAGLHVRPNFDKTPNWSVAFPKRRTGSDDAPAMTRKLVFWATDLVVKQPPCRNAAYRLDFDCHGSISRPTPDDPTPDRHHRFRLRAGRMDREGPPRARGLRLGRIEVRPDERPDVRRRPSPVEALHAVVHEP